MKQLLHKYKTTIQLFGCVVLLLSLLPSAFAEEVEKRTRVSEVEQARFEKDMEQRIARDVRAYLNHEFFIVQVSSILEKINTYEIKTIEIPVQAPVAPQSQQNPVPTQQLLAQMELETDDGITADTLRENFGVETPLPGLPLPESAFGEEPKKRRVKNTQPKAQVPQQQANPISQIKTEKKEELKDSRIAIKKLSLKVMLDEQVTTEQEVFVRNLVIEKANVSFIRGDELKLIRTAFPGALIPKEVPEEKAEEPVEEPEAVEEPPVEEPVVEETTPLSPLEQWQALLMEYWQYVAAGLAALLLLWLLLRRKKPVKQDEPEAAPQPVQVQPESPAKDKLDDFIEKISFHQDVVSENRIQVLREELVSMAVTDKSLFQKQMSEWLNAGGQEDVSRVAALLNLLGSSLMLSLLKEKIPADKLVALAAVAHDQKGELSASDQLEMVEQAFQVLSQRRYQEKLTDQHHIRPFDFLERLDDDQILYLLNDEELPVKALVFSQLPSERAAGLMKRIGHEKRAELALEISKFAQLPAAAFRDIANRLAKNAVNVPSFANISMDGVELLISMLDHMDTPEETALLGSVKHSNPDLYYRIKQSYVSFDDVVRIPNMGLKNLIREIDREELAFALYDADDYFLDVVLNAMPERPRAMLQATLDGLQKPDENAINHAKRNVARQARAMLKAGDFEMPSEELEAEDAPASNSQQ